MEMCVDCDKKNCKVCEAKKRHPAGKKMTVRVFPDAVNGPSHYISDPSGIEAIQITRHRNFNIGNAFKYLWRAGLKDEATTVEDLQKAIWYIEDEIKRLEGKNK